MGKKIEQRYYDMMNEHITKKQKKVYETEMLEQKKKWSA